ncbi:hypothetical protein SDC9_109324 [bioreactor metagenome]|uniref:4-hydroxy-tetrahydrodipicolinate synthase n=1 Tax=bioreactor metagenome TaxID=1076179 RepID=A0A645BAV6_9ZZZZ
MALYDIASPFIPTVKRGLQLAGLPIDDACTAPFLPLTEAQDEQLRQLLKKLGVL